MDMRRAFNNTINRNWIEWFIGFCDADANFQVFPKVRSYLKKDGTPSNYYNIGYGFHISLSSKDLPLLQSIQNILNGIGHIYEYPSRDEARLSVTKLADLKYLIENVFDVSPLITNHQASRYAILRYGILNNIKRVETLEEFKEFLNSDIEQAPILESFYKEGTAFDNWIVGFINGEGCFHLHKDGHKVFFIEHTDQNSLDLIKERLNLGPNVLDRGTRNNTRKNTFSLSISSKKDLLSLKELIENPLLNGLDGYKLVQYNNWNLGKELPTGEK
jgi:hypothetical protein